MPFGYAAAIGAVGSLASGIIGSGAAKSAAKTEADAANQASQTELKMFGDTQQQVSPWISGGTNALANLQKLLGLGADGTGATSPVLQMLGIGTPGSPGTGSINPSTFQGSPGYQYALQQGNNAVTNSAHGNIGGNTLRALQQNGQGLANQNWNQYLGNVGNSWQTLVGDVSNVSGTGLNAADALAGIRTGVGNRVGANQIAAGQDIAAGTIGSANALQKMISGLTSSATTGLTGGTGMGTGGGSGGDTGGLLRAFLTMLQGSGGGGGGTGTVPTTGLPYDIGVGNNTF